jgi:predicted nucleic acid-binding protein
MEKELILCDTNILIAWLKGDEQTIEILQEIGLENLLIPSIAFMELIQGIRNKIELSKLKKKIKNYNIIHFNDVTSKLAINLAEKYFLSHGLLIPDAIIAATAIAFNFKLFTYNLKDFKYIPGIQLYKK